MRKSSKQNNGDIKINKRVLNLMGELISRTEIAATMGYQYKGRRDVYQTLGYKKVIQYEDYYSKYKRQDIASRIIDAPVEFSWRRLPEITELEGEETEFEKKIKEIINVNNLYTFLRRIDKLAGIGRYAILVFGFNDVKNIDDFKNPVTKASDLVYLQPYSEINATIEEQNLVKNTRDKRYGLPEFYSVSFSILGSTLKTEKRLVHHSRVLHVADGLLEDSIYGEPRLQSVFNRLDNIELISGGSAEMFWRGARRDLILKKEADAQFDNSEQDLTALETEIERYIHDYQDFLRVQGIDVSTLTPQVADPSNHISVQLDLIASATGIPKRILMGSERGELASTQDETSWLSLMEDRRTSFNEGIILRPVIDKLIEVGVVPEPKTGKYSVDWPALLSPSEEEKVSISKAKTEALAIYANSIGASEIIPPEIFLKKFLEFTDDEIDEINDLVSEIIIEDKEQEEELNQEIQDKNKKGEKI